MKPTFPATLAVLTVWLLQPLIAAERQRSQTPDAPQAKWKFSEWKPLGKERQFSVGFQLLGQDPRLVILLSKSEDAKATPLTRLKITAEDIKGRPLTVEKHYQHPYAISFPENDAAFYQVGTPVQRIQPKEVGVVTIVGFGGNAVVRFVDGSAVARPHAE